MTDSEIEQRAREQMRNIYRNSGHNFSEEDIEKLCGDAEWEVKQWAAFARSEVEAAVQAERQACAKAACRYCNDPKFHLPVRIDDVWTHITSINGGTVEVVCDAAAIHERGCKPLKT